VRYLESYFASTPEGERRSDVIATLAGLDSVEEACPEIARSIVQELKDQRKCLKLIASENYCSLPVQHAMGNWMTDKYSEGIAGRRFYAGCHNVDDVETLAANELKKIFGCDHAYVQPHSGIDANLVAFLAVLVHRVQDEEVLRLGKKNVNQLTDEEHEKIRQLMVNQKIMGMALDSGGHLTHGYRLNISSKLFQAATYDVDPETELLDYSRLRAQVKEEKPTILIAGYSAYPRLLDFEKMREIADEVGATLMVDMAHFAGLVAGKALTGVNDPIPYADIVTSTTHKTMRGPRGGMVLCKEELRESVDKGCPYVLGGPLPHVMAAKAIAFKEANTKDFQTYAAKVITNAQTLADELMAGGCKLFTNGTDNHLIVIDVEKSFGLNGRQAENALRAGGMLVNRNTVPFDKNGPWYTSGVRIGTPAMTTRGMGSAEMRETGREIIRLLKGANPITLKSGKVSKSEVGFDGGILGEAKGNIEAMLTSFPLYPEIDVEKSNEESNNERKPKESEHAHG
jgi:glycine hydroxymethyltransferase